MVDNTDSPLIKAVVALDAHFSELERIGNKINSLEMKTEFDFAHAQQLMTRFAECGEGVTSEVVNLSNYLNEARQRADALATGVTERAKLLNSRKTNEKDKLEQFRQLGERVQVLVAQMNTLRRPENTIFTEEDRAQLMKDLAGFDSELSPLIEEAQNLRKEAHLAKMRTLEQNADSLAQTLLAARQKINSLHVPN
jgi:hypothetical protein